MTETLLTQCPYCWEIIEMLVDGPPGQHDYIEDCSVCCRPISVRAHVDTEGHCRLSVAHEDEA